MIVPDSDFPADSFINVEDELIQFRPCPNCGAQAAERNTPEGWLVFCSNGCNGRCLGVKQAAVVDDAVLFEGEVTT